jgi:hypothetical protein
MGKVKLNVVGHSNPYTMDGDYNTITLKDIYKYLINKEILLVKLIKCKFIHSGQILELDKQQFDVDDTINIYIVPNTEDKKFKSVLLMKLFNFDINSELIDTLEEEEVVEINTDLCDYFKDKDFINLLNIIKTKPEYLEMVNSYLSHGDIIDEIDFGSIEIENFEYTEQYNILMNNLMPNICEWDEEKVKKILIKFEGNVNLTSRYILV